MLAKHYLNQIFYKGLCLLIFWRIKRQQYRIQQGHSLPKNHHNILIVTRQAQSSLKPEIWEKIQAQWNWEQVGSIVVLPITPALPLSTHSDPITAKVIKRISYLRQKLKLAFLIIEQIDRCEGIILETLFSYKGELFLEELFLGCFQKTILDEIQIRKEIQHLNEDTQYDLDISALEEKINKLIPYVALHFNSDSMIQ